jgi:hypothetical protein
LYSGVVNVDSAMEIRAVAGRQSARVQPFIDCTLNLEFVCSESGRRGQPGPVPATPVGAAAVAKSLPDGYTIIGRHHQHARDHNPYEIIWLVIRVSVGCQRTLSHISKRSIR